MANVLIGVIIAIFLIACTICEDKTMKDILMCLSVGSIILTFVLGLMVGW